MHCFLSSQNLETIPRLKDEIHDQEKQIQSQEKELEEKAILLSASRKAVRDYRDQLRVFHYYHHIDDLSNSTEKGDNPFINFENTLFIMITYLTHCFGACILQIKQTGEGISHSSITQLLNLFMFICMSGYREDSVKDR